MDWAASRGTVPVFIRPTSKARFLEPLGQTGGGGVAHAAGRKIFQADVDQAVEKGAGGHHHGPDPDLLVQGGAQADRSGRLRRAVRQPPSGGSPGSPGFPGPIFIRRR